MSAEPRRLTIVGGEELEETLHDIRSHSLAGVHSCAHDDDIFRRRICIAVRDGHDVHPIVAGKGDCLHIMGLPLEKKNVRWLFIVAQFISPIVAVLEAATLDL